MGMILAATLYNKPTYVGWMVTAFDKHQAPIHHNLRQGAPPSLPFLLVIIHCQQNTYYCQAYLTPLPTTHLNGSMPVFLCSLTHGSTTHTHTHPQYSCVTNVNHVFLFWVTPSQLPPLTNPKRHLVRWLPFETQYHTQHLYITTSETKPNASNALS